MVGFLVARSDPKGYANVLLWMLTPATVLIAVVFTVGVTLREELCQALSELHDDTDAANEFVALGAFLFSAVVAVASVFLYAALSTTNVPIGGMRPFVSWVAIPPTVFMAIVPKPTSSNNTGTTCCALADPSKAATSQPRF